MLDLVLPAIADRDALPKGRLGRRDERDLEEIRLARVDTSDDSRARDRLDGLVSGALDLARFAGEGEPCLQHGAARLRLDDRLTKPLESSYPGAMLQARSELTGEMVDTSSEAWRHECEVRHLIDKMSPAQLKAYLEANDESRGTISHRGPLAVEHLKAEMQRLVEARWKAKQGGQ